MSQQLIALVTAAQVQLARLRDEEEGQTFVEWMGVMIVIIALVGVLAGSGVLNTVSTTILNEASDIIKDIKG
jgi:Flp pilus assembly pilin Flp